MGTSESPQARAWAIAPLLAFAILGLVSLRLDAATFDETAHLAAGLSYVETGDFRLNTEHPPLAKLWAAWPLRLLGRGEVDVRSPAWNGADPWILGFETLNGPRESPARLDPMRLLGPARIAILLLGVALGVVVFFWSSELWGRRGALLSLVLFALSPTMLAHARYVTTDLPAALGLSLGAWTFWRFTRRPTIGRAAVVGAAAAIALTVKFSGLLLAPMLAVVATAWVATGKDGDTRSFRTRRAFLGLVVASAIALLGVWSAYGFRYAASTDPAYSLDWSVLDARPGAASDLLRAARHHRVAPEAWLHGLAMLRVTSSRRVAYLNGETSVVGWRSYFPEAFLLKTPPALLALLGWVAWIAWRRRHAVSMATWGVLGPALVYVAFSLVTRLDIGHRHLAPLEPLLFVLLGGLAGVALRSRAGRVALGAILVSYALSCAAATPRYLSYFNLLAGGPAGGSRFLLDSNLDWGQDLARLGAWSRANGDPELLLAYFGTADPRAYGIRYRKLRMVHDFHPEEPASVPRAGDLLAVSANLLHGLYLDEDEALGRELLGRRLVTSATVSAWIRMRDEESLAGRVHPSLARWLVSRGTLPPAVVESIRAGLLPAWLDRLRSTTRPVARIGDSIEVFRVPPELSHDETVSTSGPSLDPSR